MAKVLLFGRLSDLAGWREREIEAASLGDLKAMLSLDAPGVQVAVDQVIVRGDMALTGASEVAFLPPMSGG